ncbi:MAG: hypothetical protein JNM50_00590 [Chromatiales bacterium]|jgi:hypothetical protein|nr:hypothetical protein [Chromatiales bacterium]
MPDPATASPPAGTPPAWATTLGGLAALALVAGAVVLQPLPPPPAAEAAGGEPCDLVPPGFLSGRVYGDREQILDWRGRRLRCDGGLRPDDGLRLMFSGPAGADGSELTLILGISGQLAGLEGTERPANVTVVDERSGQFYASAGPGRCWTRVSAAEPAGPRTFRIAGQLYCAGALPALQDAGSLTLGDINYAGRLVVE